MQFILSETSVERPGDQVPTGFLQAWHITQARVQDQDRAGDEEEPPRGDDLSGRVQVEGVGGAVRRLDALRA